MVSWVHVTLILCAFGLLREIRPSEPFVTEFLLGKWRDITEDQLNREVYPYGTYSYLALLVAVFLVTDFFRFKPIIILSGLSGIVVYAILLWTKSLQWLQASQFFYGLYMATEVAYLTYIYAKVEPAKYPRVSSFTRMAALAGRFISGTSSQLLTHFGLMDYRDLNYITFTAQILATFWAFWLPAVPYGIYFHRNKSATGNTAVTADPATGIPIEKKLESGSFRANVKEASRLIIRHARAAYTRPKVLAWSALYAVALALFVQLQTYMQLLWKLIQENTDSDIAYNGAVEALQTLLGAGGAYLSSIYASNSVIAPVAAVQGVSVFVGTYANNIFVSYAGYIVAGALFHYTITVASAKIAGQLSDESCFGLIFGINTLIGTALQAILTAVMIQALRLSIPAQYYTISGFYLILASVWLLAWMLTAFRQKQTVSVNN